MGLLAGPGDAELLSGSKALASPDGLLLDESVYFSLSASARA